MIYLARHGQTDWNIQDRIQGNDVPLNERGRQEAKICGQKLVSFKIDCIIASDLPRAKETAHIINKFLSVPIRFDARLREVSWGDLQGKLRTEVSDVEWDALKYNPAQIHAESLTDVYRRIKSFFDEIDVSQNTLIVTHAGDIEMVKYLSQYSDFFDQALFEKAIQDLEIKNTALFRWNKQQDFELLTDKTE